MPLWARLAFVSKACFHQQRLPRTQKPAKNSVYSAAFIISEGISSASNMLHFNVTVDADKLG